jgi:hypothetical protein
MIHYYNTIVVFGTKRSVMRKASLFCMVTILILVGCSIHSQSSKPTLPLQSTRNISKLPVSNQVKVFFGDYFSLYNESGRAEFNILDIWYEEKGDHELILHLSIQCIPNNSSCDELSPRKVFLVSFADPEPSPDRMSIFPPNLTSFIVFGYDEKMKKVDAFTGDWQDLMAYERGELMYDELVDKLSTP